MHAMIAIYFYYFHWSTDNYFLLLNWINPKTKHAECNSGYRIHHIQNSMLTIRLWENRFIKVKKCSWPIAGVAKLFDFDPRPNSPLEGRIQWNLRKLCKKRLLKCLEIALPAGKFCFDRQVNKRQAAVNSVALLSTAGNVVLEKMCEVFGGPDVGRSLATLGLLAQST